MSTSQSHCLTVWTDDHWVSVLIDVVFFSESKGRNATLECAVSGWPRATVRWSRDNGRPLPAGRSRPLGGAALLITSLQELDEGGYVCEASNGVAAPLRASTLLQLTEPVSLVKVCCLLLAF